MGSSRALGWRVQDRLPLEHSDFSRASQATLANGHDQIPPDSLCTFPQNTERNDAGHPLTEPHTNYHDCYPERSTIRLGAFSPTDPTSFSIAPDQALTFLGFQLDGQGTEPFWGYHTALASYLSHPLLV